MPFGARVVLFVFALRVADFRGVAEDLLLFRFDQLVDAVFDGATADELVHQYVALLPMRNARSVA